MMFSFSISFFVSSFLKFMMASKIWREEGGKREEGGRRREEGERKRKEEEEEGKAIIVQCSYHSRFQ